MLTVQKSLTFNSAIHAYHPLLLARLLCCISCLHRADVRRYRSINTGNICREFLWKCPLLVCPCLPSSPLHVFFVLNVWCDGRQVAIQLLFHRVLHTVFVLYSMQRSCVIPILPFLYAFCLHPSGVYIE